jgi:hypothetical protein
MKQQTLYEETIPVFVLFLENLQKVLDKGRWYSGKGGRSVSEKKLVEGKLAPDMYNCMQQVGYAYFMALEVAGTFTTKKPPELSYDEKNIAQLKESLKKVVKYLKSVKSKDFVMPSGKVKTFLSAKKRFSSERYIRELALPNFFFHVTVTYSILRHLGVPLKKEDYLGLAK